MNKTSPDDRLGAPSLFKALLGGVTALLGLSALLTDLPAQLGLIGDRLPTALSTGVALTAAGGGLLAYALRARRLALGLVLCVGLCALAQLAQILTGWQSLGPLLRAPAPRVTICLALTCVSLLLGLVHPGPGARLGIGLSGSAVAILASTALLDLGGDFQLGDVWFHRTQISYVAATSLLLLGVAGIVGGWEASGASPHSAFERRVALGAGIAVTLVFCVLWQLMLSQDQRQLEARVSANAERVRLEVQAELSRDLIAPLRRTAARWASRDRFERGQRDLQAASLYEDVSSLIALAVARPEGELRWCFPPDQEHNLAAFADRASVAHRALTEAGLYGEPRVSPLAPGPAGGAVFWIVVPLEGQGEFLVGAFDFAAFLQPHVQRQQAFGFGLDSPRANASSGASGASASADAQLRAAQKWSNEVGIELAGAEWSLRVWPTQQRVRAGSSSLPEISLVLGLVLAGLAAALLHLALNERRRGLEALATNARLAREMSERELADRRLAEQALRLEDIARALAKSNRDLEEFAYVAAHDLRSPLRAIHSLSEWIEEDLGLALTGEARESMDLLRARVNRMELLLDSLLQYSRAGRTAHDVKEVDVHAVLLDSWDLLGPPEGFELVVESELPVFQTAQAPLEQILRNLLANAVKHHDRPQGEVRVSAVPSPPGRWTFTVSDDGPGIAPQFHARIFGMFKTLRSRDRIEGSGMGLALIKRLVNRYAGEVEVISTGDEQRGTTFRFDWPAALDPGEARDAS